MRMAVWCLLLLGVILVSGCTIDNSRKIKGNAEIDWVDFVKMDGHSYTGDWQLMLKDPGEVTGEEIGEVKFTVADVVTNPNFKTRDGDAASLPIGTKLYRLNGYEKDEIIVAKDENRIGGYRLFVEDSYRKHNAFGYTDVPKDKVEKIELYQSDEVSPYKVLQHGEQQSFIQLLESGKESPSYNANTKSGDPEYYKMVFYTDSTIAYAYSIVDDHENVFFSTNVTRLLDVGIRELLQPE